MTSLRSLLILALIAGAAAEPGPAAAPSPAAPAAELAAAPLARDFMVGELRRELTSHFNLEGELQLDLPRGWVPPAKAAIQWLVEITEFPAIASAAMLVRCRIFGDGVMAADSAFVVTARHLREVWIARGPVTAGAVFDATALDVRRVDLFRDREALPVSVGDRNSIFARSVPAGRALTWRDVARRPLVRKGDIVDVSIAEGRLIVTMKGRALESGAQGDIVNIQNPDSRKSFAAVVTHENHVQVRF